MLKFSNRKIQFQPKIESKYLQVYVVRTYVQKSSVLLRRGDDISNDDKGSDKNAKQKDLIRILNQKQNLTILSSKSPESGGSNSNLSGGTGGDNAPTSSDSTTNNSGSGKRTFNCPKCGAACTHIDSLVSLSRFVKCEKCSHFFVVMAEDRKPLNVSTFFGDKQHNHQQQQQQQQQQKPQFKPTPPPPPKKIYEFLNKYIIGQEHSKKVISVAVYNHYKRINSNIAQASLNAAPIGKANQQAAQHQQQPEPKHSPTTIPEILSGKLKKILYNSKIFFLNQLTCIRYVSY